MHFGEFPIDYRPGRDHLAFDLAPRLPAASLSRRSLLFAVPAVAGVLIGGGGVAALSGWVGASAGTVRPPQPGEIDGDRVERGTLAWALWVRRGPADGFLSAAGDLERVRMAHPRAAELIAVFEDLLDLSLRSAAQHADLAGAIAVRSLARLDSTARLLRDAERIGRRDDRPETVRALQRARVRAERGR